MVNSFVCLPLTPPTDTMSDKTEDYSWLKSVCDEILVDQIFTPKSYPRTASEKRERHQIWAESQHGLTRVRQFLSPALRSTNVEFREAICRAIRTRMSEVVSSWAFLLCDVIEAADGYAILETCVDNIDASYADGADVFVLVTRCFRLMNYVEITVKDSLHL